MMGSKDVEGIGLSIAPKQDTLPILSTTAVGGKRSLPPAV